MLPFLFWNLQNSLVIRVDRGRRYGKVLLSVAGVAAESVPPDAGRLSKMSKATLAVEMGKAITVETQDKWEQICLALTEMAVGACAVKWDLVVWRVGQDMFIVGEQGVRKDAARMDITEAVFWFAWKRGLVKTGYFA